MSFCFLLHLFALFLGAFLASFVLTLGNEDSLLGFFQRFSCCSVPPSSDLQDQCASHYFQFARVSRNPTITT